MTHIHDHIDYWARPGRHTAIADDVPRSGDLREVVRIVQGLLVYDVVAEPFYGVSLSAGQADAVHERDTQRLLELAQHVDPRPLDVAREPGARVGARCHVFTRLTVALLRAAGVPARARCGFGGYFRPGWFEDHWVAEVWDGDGGRWRMVDAQLDDTWRQKIAFDGDPLDLTPEQFVTAGHAWLAWRRGELDAGRCGLSAIDEHGVHWIAHNLRLDLAALNKVEMLPWDLWGAGWEPGDEPTSEQIALFDEVAELTTQPDARSAELRARYEGDAQLHMDGTDFNVFRGRAEQVGP